MNEAAPNQPVRPRDAASLILLLPGPRGHRCLMGRRHADSKFLPGYHVFPGGAVAPPDRAAVPASPLDLTHLAAMGVGGNPRAAAALGVAAVRETCEETGIMIGAAGDVGDAPGSVFAEMRRRGMAPALGRLIYVGRAISPASSGIRFHARFFLTRLLPGEIEFAGDDELHDLSWVPLGEIGSRQTLGITRFMADFARRIIDSASVLPPGRPVLTFRRRQRVVRYL